MRIYIFLVLVCATSTLARSKYKRETSGISFSDNAGISAGLNGVEGHFKKNIGLKPYFLNPFDKSSKSKEIGLNIDGNLGLKPKLSLGEKGKGLGISLGGSGGLGVGISGNKEKKHSGKKNSKTHKQSKEDSSSDDSSEESIVEGILKGFSNGISAGIKGDADLSFGTGGVSSYIDGEISAGVNAKEDKSSSEEEVIVIPIVDGKNSGSYEIDGTKPTNKTDNVKGVVVVSLGDKEKSGNLSDNKDKKQIDKNASEKHQNKHSGKKEENNGEHSGKGSIIISHEKDGRNGNKEHTTEKENYNNHTRGEGDIVISHEEHNSQTGSKGHHGSVKGHKSKNDGKTKGSSYEEGEESITISDGNDGQLNGKHNSHNVSKKHQGPERNKSKTDGKSEGSKSAHTGGSVTISHGNNGQASSSDHREHNSINRTGENISHKNNHGKHIGVTVGGSHNENKNSTEKSSAIDGKSSNHGQNNRNSNNCNEILNNGKCGSNIKQTLQVVQTFIHGCHAIVYFLLELNEAELRRVLCEVLPHDSKLSCQLGCNILRFLKRG